jgi:hypothetical protein
VAHVNHRTTDEDIETLAEAIVEIGREITAEGR